MAKYRVFGRVDGERVMSEFEANSPEEAALMALNSKQTVVMVYGGDQRHPMQWTGESVEAFQARMKDPDSWGKHGGKS